MFNTQTKGKLILKFFIGAFLLAGIIAPYIHMGFDRTSTVKAFGFRNAFIFLYSFGVPASLFACSTLLLYVLQYAPQKVRKYFVLIALLFVFNSFFQFMWLLWPRQDLPYSTYFGVIITVSVLFVSVYYFIFKYYTSNQEHLKTTIRNLFSFIYTETDNQDWIKEEKKELHKKSRTELVNKAVQND